MLDLVPVSMTCLKIPTSYPDAVADRRYVESGQRVQQADSEPAQAPGAQAGLDVQGVDVSSDQPMPASAWRASPAVPLYMASWASWWPSMYSADR